MFRTTHKCAPAHTHKHGWTSIREQDALSWFPWSSSVHSSSCSQVWRRYRFSRLISVTQKSNPLAWIISTVVYVCVQYTELFKTSITLHLSCVWVSKETSMVALAGGDGGSHVDWVTFILATHAVSSSSSVPLQLSLCPAFLILICAFLLLTLPSVILSPFLRSRKHTHAQTTHTSTFAHWVLKNALWERGIKKTRVEERKGAPRLMSRIWQEVRREQERKRGQERGASCFFFLYIS